MTNVPDVATYVYKLRIRSEKQSSALKMSVISNKLECKVKLKTIKEIKNVELR